MHGNAETPAAVGALVADAAARGPVTLALEWPDELQPAVDAFVAGGPRTALLAACPMFWGWRDGRSSHAMVALVESVATLGVRVHCFDGVWAGDRERDSGMAASILRAIDARGGTWIALCGNLHARSDEARWMAWHLRQARALVALDARPDGGTTWAAQLDSVGPLSLGHPRGTPVGLAWYAQRDERGYDGELHLGPVTASPPAGA
jgi:hypothetical protein